MAQGKEPPNKPGRIREICSLFAVFAAVFLLLCLFSYRLPVGAILAPIRQANWGGLLGNFLAGSLWGFFGISTIWLPALLFLFAVRLMTLQCNWQNLPAVLAGCTGILLASSGLSGLLIFEHLILFDHRYPLAGNLGKNIANLAIRFLGIPGSFLLFLMILLVSLMLVSSFSPYRLAGCMTKGCLALVQRCGWRPGKDRPSEPRPPEPLSLIAEPRKSRTKEGGEPPVPAVHQPLTLGGSSGDEQEFRLLPAAGEYRLPGLALLDRTEVRELGGDREYYYTISRELEDKLKDFGVEGTVVGISPGPVITTYEFAPAPGIKISRIISLADDLALCLKTESVRIVGSIPGKAALGIEIPNPERHIVHVRDIFSHEKFQKASSKLALGLGMDVVGNPVIADLARMPHLLIAGATGSGKSVAVNTIICSILFNATPDEVRLLLIDPKRIELSGYEDIPHLLHPVVVDPKLASRALLWAVREMERRYQLMEEAKVKSLASYNEAAEVKLPLIVIIIDELADLMMVSSREVEDAVARLAQMARAAGMHLILATQRPSVDVLTGLIKANFPTRMSFKVSSKIDSRTILDGSGAEHLLGAGDMLFMPPGASKLQRIHGAYISEGETERIVGFLKQQGTVHYDETVLSIDQDSEGDEVDADLDLDEKYDEAVALVCETGQASISMVQRRLRIGYNRAARMIELMEKEGVVGPADGSKSREVLARKTY